MTQAQAQANGVISLLLRCVRDVQRAPVSEGGMSGQSALRLVHLTQRRYQNLWRVSKIAEAYLKEHPDG